MSYTQVSFEEREIISRLTAKKMSNKAIAKKLGRHRSTIGREIKRISVNKLHYRALTAQQDAQLKKQATRKGKVKINRELGLLIEHRILNFHWSPEQVCHDLKIKYPHQKKYHISHESIYSWIYNHAGFSRKELLVKRLRRKKAKRGSILRSGKRKGAIVGGMSIHERPKEVETRSISGHWEGDFIVGKNHQSAILTLVERRSRYLMMIPFGRKKDAVTVKEKLVEKFEKLPSHLKKSLTYDRGSEMAKHKEISLESGVPVYFADPGSPWQRGTNENTNGLIREFFPKGIDLNQFSIEDAQEVQNILNQRPKKVLKYATAKEAFRWAITKPKARLSEFKRQSHIF